MKTVRTAQNLQMRGYHSKEVIGVIAGDVANLAPIVFASICLGCPINPIHTKSEQSIIRMLEITEPSLIFCEVKLYDMTVKCLSALGINANIFTLDGAKGQSETVENLFIITGKEENFTPVEVDGFNEAAVIASTSGSTGPSKGVCISHAALVSEIDVYLKMYTDEVAFNHSSIYWISGFLTLLLNTIGGSTRIITTEQFSPEMQLRIIEQYKVMVLDTHLLQILKSDRLPKTDLSCVKYLFVGGYKIPHSALKKFNSLLPNGSVLSEYGLTEIGAVSLDSGFTCKDTVGLLVNGVYVKIIDENGKHCGLGENGEIYVKNVYYKFLGYYKNEKLTVQSFDSEGYLKTGDIGNLDEDGYLHLDDRKKSVIRYQVNWIFPCETEEIVIKCPDVMSTCVVGIQHNDSLELPAAAVVPAEGSNLTEEAISKMVEGSLPDHCKLRGGVCMVDCLPTTETGKPLRGKIKEILAEPHKAKAQKELQ